MKNIAFYGAGNISTSIITGLIYSGFNSKNIFYIDRNPKNHSYLRKLKTRNLESNQNQEIDLFILAVKPKDAFEAYKEILEKYKKPKIVSLVAGIKSKKYIKINHSIEFLRAMPNTSSASCNGITAIYNSSFKKNNLKKVISLFNKVGLVLNFDKESKIDSFTGMIGSGPAYFFYLLKSYEKKLNHICNGDKKLIKNIIVNLLQGVAISIDSGTDFNDLIKQVASKKGTTEAGLNTFKKNKLNKLFEEGIESAIKRSREISSEY